MAAPAVRIVAPSSARHARSRWLPAAPGTRAPSPSQPGRVSGLRWRPRRRQGTLGGGRGRGPPGPPGREGRALRPEPGAGAAAPRARPLCVQRPRHLARGRGVGERLGAGRRAGGRPGEAAPLHRGPGGETPSLPSYPETFPTLAGVLLAGFGGCESLSGGGSANNTHVPQHACGGGPLAHRQGLDSGEVAEGGMAPGGLPAARDSPRAGTNRCLKSCPSSEGERCPRLCVTLPTAPPRAKASPCTHALTHPTPGCGQSLPLYFCDDDR